MLVLNSIGRVAAQYTYNEHASKLLPCWYPALWVLRFSVVTYSECVHWSLILGLYYLGASPRGRGRSAVNRLQLKTHRRFKSFRARHFKVGNMSRDKTEYQISKIGHVQHSRLVLRHSIQMILYGRIIDYYWGPLAQLVRSDRLITDRSLVQVQQGSPFKPAYLLSWYHLVQV